MADSYSKKENNKKKVKKQQDKLLRRSDRKVNNNKGKSLEEMLVYVDFNGNLTSTPPHLQQQSNPELTNNARQASGNDQNLSSGYIKFIKETGFGFITEDQTKDNVFFNFDTNDTNFKINVRVNFKKETSSKGFRASQIVIIK